jgi:hypothetical protein
MEPASRHKQFGCKSVENPGSESAVNGAGVGRTMTTLWARITAFAPLSPIGSVAPKKQRSSACTNLRLQRITEFDVKRLAVSRVEPKEGQRIAESEGFPGTSDSKPIKRQPGAKAGWFRAITRMGGTRL